MIIAPQKATFFHADTTKSKPVVGISGCLAGEKVRYDGGDKRLPLLKLLYEKLSILTVCPESLAGLGTPRPPVQLVMKENELQVRGRDTPELDVTDALLQQRSHCYRELRGKPLCGFILKSRSPSCGLATTPVFLNGTQASMGHGVFTDGLLRIHPWLVTCDETQLGSEDDIEQFVWQCRLAQDILFTSTSTPLAELHRHYSGQLDGIPEDALQQHVQRDDREEYLHTLIKSVTKPADMPA